MTRAPRVKGPGGRLPHVADDRIVNRWIALEMRGINRGLVVKRRLLADLLREVEPQAVTREGEPYLFGAGELARLETATTREEQGRLRLPITLRFHFDLENQCSLDDELATAVFRRLEGFGKAYPFREGRAWLPYALGLDLVRRYPTVLQRVLVP